MSGFQFSAATITKLLGGAAASAQNTNADSAQKDEFASLLDVVGANNTDLSVAPIAPSPVQFSQPLPKPIRDVQSDIRPVLVKRNDNEKSTSKELSPSDKMEMKPERVLYEKRSAQKSSDKEVPDENDSVQPASSVAASVESTEKPFGQPSQPENTDDVTELSDAASAKNSERVDSLSNLLNMLGAFLAKAGGALSQMTANSATVSPVVSGQIASEVGAVQSGDVATVLANTQSVLQNIQQLLQMAGGEDATLSQDAQLQLDALNQALAEDIAALKDMFPSSLKNQAATDTAISAELSAPDLPVLDDAKDSLRNDIANIRNVLQKFKTELPQPLVQSQTLETAVSELTAAIKPDTFAKHATVETALAAQSAMVSAQPQVNITQSNNVHNMAAQSVVAEQFSSSGNQNFSGQSGQQSGQQNNTALANISGLSANTQQTAADVQRPSFSGLLSRTSQTPVTQQVVFHVKNAAIDGSSKIHIQLDPESLGKLDIKLHVDAEGKTGVTIIADKQGTLDLLQRDSQGLQKALADAGLKTEDGSLSFNLRGGNQERQQGQNGSQAAAQYRKSQPEEEITPLAIVSRSYAVNVVDGLDIKI